MCLLGAVVASQSSTQEVAGSNPFAWMTNIFVTKFNEKHLGKTQFCPSKYLSKRSKVPLVVSVTLTVRVNEALNTRKKTMETRKICESDETNTYDERKLISFVGYVCAET